MYHKNIHHQYIVYLWCMYPIMQYVLIAIS
nr:MAG TPA: hypothetical protein [Caudoviricetes sp.]